jgi:23S rRNA (pseudouridine1915-N3)-methyltransferase
LKITLAAVGRMKPGPEQALLGGYLDRAGQAGRQLALGPFARRATGPRSPPA